MLEPGDAAKRIKQELDDGLDISGKYFTMLLARPDLTYRQKHDFIVHTKALLINDGVAMDKVPDMRITLTLSKGEFMGFVNWQ